ncbi:sigma-70 family RNA polymerase sigma factor [Pseudobacillus badius]|uniref:sigma-70 family RNA polymerase sigma factor n=1 Tax=Bacillus badius TaxID=1455 RepID=UPI0007B03B4B|nr:sigma-70 family RNA polymerase sigma factor [Bacillus badius]KZO01005.1 RNA polymerase factor sigma C [Bacillus badius]MED0665203.1 sigma-70 family RNA polymerase sigma factor [Bacillus badius]OCS89042.1 RNA polymerase factor sigma C [Bacillus badius]TDW00512.1 RNA polymerase sigma-70 factor (ECF subfamily) [Bacillus badius]GLY12327.1 RNA polymerase subunit sigma [Bacillus badius]
MEETFIEVLQDDEYDLLFHQVMTKYGRDVLVLAYSYVKNKDIAEDLTQEIFVKCYQSLCTFNHGSKLKTWLWRIAINHCKDYLKSWHNRYVEVADAHYLSSRPSQEDVEGQVIKRDKQAGLIEAVLQLPVPYREIIYLHYYEDLSLKEIEYITGININTVKTRLRRAKDLLKTQLEE